MYPIKWSNIGSWSTGSLGHATLWWSFRAGLFHVARAPWVDEICGAGPSRCSGAPNTCGFPNSRKSRNKWNPRVSSELICVTSVTFDFPFVVRKFQVRRGNKTCQQQFSNCANLTHWTKSVHRVTTVLLVLLRTSSQVTALQSRIRLIVFVRTR